MKKGRASSRAWVLAVLVAVALAGAVAGIAKAKAGSQQLETIRRRMETGLALFTAGKAADAAAEFEAGYAEHPYSAFLFNAGVCYQKAGDADKALDRYREYLRVDPSAPDIDAVQKRIAALEGAKAAAPPPPPPPPPGDAGAAVAPSPPPTPVTPTEQVAAAEPATEEVMRSLVVVETEPPGAPLKVYLADSDETPAFHLGTTNPGWKQVATTQAPTSLSLTVGRYHVVVDKFRDFNVSETDIKVSAGHVHQFKANLSQGAFMSFLRVSANVKGAHIWIDDPKKAKPEWGTTPYGELVASGDHDILVEVPGFQPLRSKVSLTHGEQKELDVRLARVEFGTLRIDADAPDAKIRIDREPHGVWKSGEPPLEVTVSAGKHQLSIEGTGRKTYEGTIDVPRGQVLPVHAKLIPKFPRGGAWTQAIVSGVLIGTGVFFGSESNKLHDQLERDRAAGVLDGSDGRIMRGRIYSITADCAFVAGGVLAAFSTYNFVRDPLPESSTRLDKAQEFDDPLKQRPTSLSPRPREEREARRRTPRTEEPSSAKITAGPAAIGNGGGLVIGGTF